MLWYTIRWLQFANADYIQEKKIGIKFLIDAFSEEMLINGIMEVRIWNINFTLCQTWLEVWCQLFLTNFEQFYYRFTSAWSLIKPYVIILTPSHFQVITNPKFKNNIQQLSNQMRDTLSSPRDTAVFWIHYSIRNRGCSYLKSHSMHLYWFQVSSGLVWSGEG